MSKYEVGDEVEFHLYHKLYFGKVVEVNEADTKIQIQSSEVITIPNTDVLGKM